MAENKHTLSDLYQMQSLPLSAKIRMTEYRIRQWYEAFDGNVYVSFSGGKDSTVLLDIARRLYPDIEAVFVNTGLEYPSVRKFALSKGNVTELKPQMNFKDVVIKYGYPIIGKEVSQNLYEARRNPNSRAASKFDPNSAYCKKYTGYSLDKWRFLFYAPFLISHKCCEAMKKKPAKKFEEETGKFPIIAMLAWESNLRKRKWIKNGCNAFDQKRPQSNPMSFWTENDVLTYIHENHLEIAEAYGNIVVNQKEQIEGQMNLMDFLGDYSGCKFCTTGCKRTGCIFCLFGITQDLFRIYNLQKQESKLADYVLRGGEFGENGMWQPNSKGMGYWFVLDWLEMNGIHIPYTNADHYRSAYGNERTRNILKQKETS